jgi:hypothetical protein
VNGRTSQSARGCGQSTGIGCFGEQSGRSGCRAAPRRKPSRPHDFALVEENRAWRITAGHNTPINSQSERRPTCRNDGPSPNEARHGYAHGAWVSTPTNACRSRSTWDGPGFAVILPAHRSDANSNMTLSIKVREQLKLEKA